MTEYKMRELKTSDIFKMSKILKKLDVKLQFDKDVTQQQAGAQMLQKVAENLHLAEEEVNGFLGELVNVSGKDFGNLPIKDAIKIISLFKDQEGIGSFLQAAKA